MDTASDSAPPRLYIEVTSSFENLEPVIDESQTFVAAHLDDDDLTYQVVLLVSEAVTNAMKHGNRFDDGKQVRLEIVIREDRVIVCVQDEGQGFDPEAIENPLDESNLMRESGRGLFLMKRMADVVTYDRDRRELCLELVRPER
ncbi:MAG: ATP-binding protein [Bacteroidetes bacterium]|jgi:serine/threonine-protein kinase RsbW|nr:ATP-binding protein [Bacteroidota bacterium]